MGIYVFRPRVLREVLVGSPHTDFGKEVIPASLSGCRVFAFPYDGYWTDIGTIPSFHQANLDLTLPLPPLNLYDPDYPIYTHARYLPGTKINQCVGVDARSSARGRSSPARQITDSIVGIRAVVRTGTVLERSIVMGANYFETHRGARPGHGMPLGIGRDCHDPQRDRRLQRPHRRRLQAAQRGRRSRTPTPRTSRSATASSWCRRTPRSCRRARSI